MTIILDSLDNAAKDIKKDDGDGRGSKCDLDSLSAKADRAAAAVGFKLIGRTALKGKLSNVILQNKLAKERVTTRSNGEEWELGKSFRVDHGKWKYPTWTRARGHLATGIHSRNLITQLR